MLWLLLALTAHVGNAAVFIVDKSLLNSGGSISQPLRLTFYSGIISAAAILLLPFGYAPLTSFIVGWSAVSSLFFLGALWLFFTALKAGEPSRIVPITGSAVPLFTLLFAVLFLGEQLAARHVLAFVFLVSGGALLSIRGFRSRAGSARALAAAILGGAAFAAHFATVKYIYSGAAAFWPAFVYSRVMVGLLALVVLGPLLLIRRALVAPGPPTRHRPSAVAGAFWGSKVLGTTTFILQNYAISLGSVTLVNALQGTQYVAVLALAAASSHWFPRLFHEELHRVAVGQKIVGILAVSLGVALLVT